MNTQPPFLSEIHLPSSAKIEDEIVVEIKGNWPNPSWRHDETDIAIDTDKKEVEIKYQGKSSGGLTTQVLKPLSVKLKITLPAVGVWKIRVVGRAQTITKEITVE